MHHAPQREFLRGKAGEDIGLGASDSLPELDREIFIQVVVLSVYIHIYVYSRQCICNTTVK